MAQAPKARVVIDSSGVVHAHVSPEVLFNIDATQSLMKSILGKLGCQACCSGFQIIFKQEAGEFNI